MLPFFFIFYYLYSASASHHWIMTETGRIEPKINGAFPVHRPYDLFSILEQEQRVTAVTEMHEKLVKFKNSVDEQWSAIELETEFEKRFYATDPNCKYAGFPLSMYDTTPVFVDFASQKFWTPNELAAPDCKKVSKLDFSLMTFPHLRSLREHENITEAMDAMDTNAALDIDLAKMLKMNQSDWTAYNLATYYWHVKGNFSNAIECIRRAIYFAPREHRHLPLYNLGSLLHSIRSLGESAIVLHASIDMDRSQHQSHMALGHVYTYLGDYTRAVGCYENALSLRPDLVELAKHRAAILCHQALINGLWGIDAALKKIVEELQEYSKLQERWVLTYTQIGLEKACGSSTVPSPDNLRSLWQAVEHQALLLSERITQTNPIMAEPKKPEQAGAGVQSSQTREEPVETIILAETDDLSGKSSKKHSKTQIVTFKNKVSIFQTFMMELTKPPAMPPTKMKEKIIEKLVQLVGNYNGHEPKASPYWEVLGNCLEMLEEDVLPDECGQQIFAEYVQLNEKHFPGAEEMMDESIIENYRHDEM